MMDDTVKLPYATRLLLTNKCNLNCNFCLVDAAKVSNAKEFDTAEWLAFIEKLKEYRVFKISLSGGEIFLRDDIFILLKKLRDNRMHKITLLTNGTLITEEIA
jgi:MoaA/NifB/PqqE/SkfB family radical SAM enzyme